MRGTSPLWLEEVPPRTRQAFLFCGLRSVFHNQWCHGRPDQQSAVNVELTAGDGTCHLGAYSAQMLAKARNGRLTRGIDV